MRAQKADKPKVTISARVTKEVAKETNKRAKEAKMSQSQYIEKAVGCYNKKNNLSQVQEGG